jgi:predicted transcriptional regulator
MAGANIVDELGFAKLTANIVSAHVAGNTIAASEIPELIASVHGALVGLGKAPEPLTVEKPKGAVPVRASIKPDGLISMIDGKKYQTLRRHIGRHGYTPESYREAFGLPRDYPMTSAGYSERRRGVAVATGLGRKVAAATAVGAAIVATAAVAGAPTAKPARKQRSSRSPAEPTEAPMALVATARARGASGSSPPAERAVGPNNAAAAPKERRKPLKLKLGGAPTIDGEAARNRAAHEPDDSFDLAKN